MNHCRRSFPRPAIQPTQQPVSCFFVSRKKFATFYNFFDFDRQKMRRRRWKSRPTQIADWSQVPQVSRDNKVPTVKWPTCRAQPSAVERAQDGNELYFVLTLRSDRICLKSGAYLVHRRQSATLVQITAAVSIFSNRLEACK